MNSISNFLEKFLRLDRDNKLKLSLILETVEQKTKLKLSKENIDIKGDNLRLNCSPIIRNEIFMRKEEIESALRDSKIFLRLV